MIERSLIRRPSHWRCLVKTLLAVIPLALKGEVREMAVLAQAHIMIIKRKARPIREHFCGHHYAWRIDFLEACQLRAASSRHCKSAFVIHESVRSRQIIHRG